ncbi:MAG: YrzE family protein [Ignavibacteriae bacterium]|nr:YrzE family protein [Ignavibacteriota bacterium]
MEKPKNKISLKEKWVNFFNLIWDPLVVFLVILTAIFIYFSNIPLNKNILSVLILIITLVSGLLGGVIANKWAEMTEFKVLVARGKSAIRSLKLILLNVAKIEKRTNEYIIKLDKDNKEYKLVVCNFEEVMQNCRILKEEIISSIENWTDIIPEVENLKTQVGFISEMVIKVDEKENEIKLLNEKIKIIKDEGGKEKEFLLSNLTEKERELSDLKSLLFAKEKEINTSVLSGLSSPAFLGSPVNPNLSGLGADDISWLTVKNPLDYPLYNSYKYFHAYVDLPKKCSNCGNEFTPSHLGDTICDNCKDLSKINFSPFPK